MADGDISAEEFGTWLTASAALAAVGKVMGHAAAGAILTRTSAGLIVVRAEHVIKRTGGDEVTSLRARVPKEACADWQHHKHGGTHNLWTTNDADFNSYPSHFQFFGLRFDPDGIAKMVPPKPYRGIVSEIATSFVPSPLAPAPQLPLPVRTPAPPIKPQGSPEPSRAGRPRKEFWDELWAAICSQIYHGELLPEKQADIEKAMLDWASSKGHDLSEQSARQRARLLIAAIKSKDKN